MSLDIDLRCEPERVSAQPSIESRAFYLGHSILNETMLPHFAMKKLLMATLCQLDLLADLSRTQDNEPILKVYGMTTSLDLCLVDGAENLNVTSKRSKSTAARRERGKL